MTECDYCQHVEMCRWLKDVEEQGCEFFDDGNKTDVLDKIRADIEKATEDFYYDEHDLGVRAGFRFALEIIDKYRKEKE